LIEKENQCRLLSRLAGDTLDEVRLRFSLGEGDRR
jgi:hypothetical protein